MPKTRGGCTLKIDIQSMCVNTLTGDQSLLETAANVIISLPFIFLGMQTPRKNLNMKVYANSLIGVGIASSLYHSSREKLRKYLRWADYTMIASATVVSRLLLYALNIHR
ncbi:hypothetical protein F2Q70_00045232 [Brassica cretica]|uniref:Uncharacterized protein n=1 Tax=Brassica cretica TaxID=69181 RepID=A0A8S9KFI0_BRACR|nr:hypothetical protein F2Q70_00045232 [Brassica cretica]